VNPGFRAICNCTSEVERVTAACTQHLDFHIAWFFLFTLSAMGFLMYRYHIGKLDHTDFTVCIVLLCVVGVVMIRMSGAA